VSSLDRLTSCAPLAHLPPLDDIAHSEGQM
jgi:hypothetical protein